jgi:hypothetical protein
MKNALPLCSSLDEKKGKEQFTLYLCYLSILKHFQSSAEFDVRRRKRERVGGEGSITTMGNPIEWSAKLFAALAML